MQPEVDLEKARRASGPETFQDSSFHNYMARKIDMQHPTNLVSNFHLTLVTTTTTTTIIVTPSLSPPVSTTIQKKTPSPLSIITSLIARCDSLETNNHHEIP
jgi:hypothetical protein